MSATTFKDLAAHVGHNIQCVTYGDPVGNVSLECEDCGEVLIDFNAPGNGDGYCAKCGGDLMEPGDTLCVDCDVGL